MACASFLKEYSVQSVITGNSMKSTATLSKPSLSDLKLTSSQSKFTIEIRLDIFLEVGMIMEKS